MRNFAAISIMTYYLIATIGVAVNVHYCHGELASVKIYLSNSACECGKMMGKMDCCDDEAYFFQLEDDHKISNASQEMLLDAPEPAFIDKDEWLIEEDSFKEFQEHPDPPPPGPDVRILYQSLTYYG